MSLAECALDKSFAVVDAAVECAGDEEGGFCAGAVEGGDERVHVNARAVVEGEGDDARAVTCGNKSAGGRRKLDSMGGRCCQSEGEEGSEGGEEGELHVDDGGGGSGGGGFGLMVVNEVVRRDLDLKIPNMRFPEERNKEIGEP